jgi:hypothetical protein
VAQSELSMEERTREGGKKEDRETGERKRKK